MAETIATRFTESQLQAAVVQLARLRGWLVYHTYDSRRSHAGFPDLVLVRERVVFAELKAEKGVLSPQQSTWLRRLDDAGAEWFLWRPEQWLNGEVERVLT